MTCKIHLKDLLADVIIVQLAVAQRNVHIKSKVLAVLDQDFLVDVCGLLHADAHVDRFRKIQFHTLPDLSLDVNHSAFLLSFCRSPALCRSYFMFQFANHFIIP